MAVNGWADAASWDDDAPAPPPRPRVVAAANREVVTIVVCPICKSRDVRRHSVVGAIAYWICDAGPHRWKEPAPTGSARGHIA